jgi:hypothetical protein
MPLGLVVLIVIVISALRKGTDTPQNVLCAVLGDQSDGTILERPIDMAGEFVATVWGIVSQVWSRGGGDNPAVQNGLVFLGHVAQSSGVVG